MEWDSISWLFWVPALLVLVISVAVVWTADWRIWPLVFTGFVWVLLGAFLWWLASVAWLAALVLLGIALVRRVRRSWA